MHTITIAALGLAAITGCRGIQYNPGKVGPSDEANQLVQTCYEAIDDVISQHPFYGDLNRVLVSTVVDINDVRRTTMFGRVVSECLASRLTQTDKDVIHATVRADNMLVRQDGQFLLSREVRNLAVDYNARSALVSTYAVTEYSVILSLKLVSTIEDSTLAGVDVVIPRTGTISEMLGSSTKTSY